LQVAVALFIVLYLVAHLNQGWVPHDEGAFAESAQRVADGELPHRDFAEMYTGGMSFLNAGILKVFGPDIFWLRVPMLVLFLGYLVVLFRLARLFASPLISWLATLFAVSWGLPTYPAVMPSWYQMMLAIFGVYFVLKFYDDRRTVWLFAAGLCGGFSLCFKITGVWYVAAVVIFLTYLGRRDSKGITERRRVRLPVFVAESIVPVLTLLVVIGVMRPHLKGAELVNLVLPVAAVCALAALDPNRRAGSAAALGARTLRPLGVFAGGVALPVALFSIPFAVTGSLGALVTGVFVTPQARLDSANGTYLSTQSPRYLWLALGVVAVFAAGQVARPSVRHIMSALAVLGLSLSVALGSTLDGYQTFWHVTRAVVPCIVVLGTIALATSRRFRVGDDTYRPAMYLLLIMTAFLGLCQFPFGAPVYFCFFGPVAALAALATLRWFGSDRQLLPASALVALALFGFMWLGNGDVISLGWTPDARAPTTILDSHRASIRVPAHDKAIYGEAARLLETHSRGDFTFAGPDSAELYVLSGLRNPTRSLFDVLDPSGSARGEKLVNTLKLRNVSAIAINRLPAYSPPLGSNVVARLRGMYPQSRLLGPFEIRWREP
jgi:hypothetical protein